MQAVTFIQPPAKNMRDSEYLKTSDQLTILDASPEALLSNILSGQNWPHSGISFVSTLLDGRRQGWVKREGDEGTLYRREGVAFAG